MRHLFSSSRKAEQADIGKWLFIYGLCFAIWHIIPVFLGPEIWNKTTLGDLMDLTAPYVILSIMCKLYLILRQQVDKTMMREKLFFFVHVLLFIGLITAVEGHGIHLSGNAIYRHLKSFPNTPLSRLTYFFDEIQGHTLWEIGLLLIVSGILLLGIHSKIDMLKPSSQRWIWVGALLYGFTHFANGVEGQTVVFTFPAAILIPGLLIFTFRNNLKQIPRHPIVTFYLVAFLFSDILFAVWGLLNHGFPEFSDLGWF